jgi:C-terminal processing protease CtpA/Prc
MRTIDPETRRRFGAALLCAALLAACVPERGTIGAVIAQDDESGRLFLREVPPDLAAARANLKVGDEILLIDGLDVRFMDPKQINAALVGDVDSTVKLTMIRDQQVLRVTLKRTQAQKLLSRSKKSAATSP